MSGPAFEKTSATSASGRRRFDDPDRPTNAYLLCPQQEGTLRQRALRLALGPVPPARARAQLERRQTAIQCQRRLLEWYRLHGEASERPDEHEVVAHMILLPLLALGWSEQLLEVEWKKVDLSGFPPRPPRPRIA